MKISEKIYKLRKSMNISQEELALRLEVSRQAVSKWESDNSMPDTQNIILISQIFGVSVDYLLNDDIIDQGNNSVPKKRSKVFIIGVVLCVLGLFGCVVTAGLILLNSSAALSDVETITLNINGYFISAVLFGFVLAISAIVLGIMYFKNRG